MFMAKGIFEDTYLFFAVVARSFVLVNVDVVMFVGVRLNWLLVYGKKGWAVDI